jgi:Ca-activated chloride channel family protein
VTLAVVALAGPQWGVYWTQQRARGRDILVALDVSRSMLADDVTPSRLDRAKADLLDLVSAVEQSGGHRLGLLVFAGQASLKCPLTQVYSHFRLVLDGVNQRSVARGGTLIGDCLRAAIEAYDDKTQNFRDLILISDGEDMDSFPREAAAQARDAGITIYAIGLGDPVQGSPIPYTDSAGRTQFVEHQGEIVRSKLDETTLRAIAQITGGAYVPAGTRTIELDRIFRELIEPKTKRDLAESSRERLRERYQWFLAPAMLLLVLELFLQDRRRRFRPPSRSASYNASGGQAPSPQNRERVRQSVLPVALGLLVLLAPRAATADDARTLVRDGNRLYEQGKFAEAADRYAQAVPLAPESAIPLHNQAAARFQAGDYQGAAQLYLQSRGRAPEAMRPQINYALGNCQLQQALQGQNLPEAASRDAQAAIQFYRDSIAATARHGSTQKLADSARHNLELAKRLLLQLEQQIKQQQQSEQGSGQSQQAKSQQGDQTQPQGPDANEQQPEPDSAEPDPQTSAPQPTEQQSRPARPSAAEQLTPEEAADRLRSAVSRAHMARARRLTDQDKKATGGAVERDW